MTNSQALLARYHAGELDDNGVLALIDAMQDDGDGRAAGYAFIRRWGCAPYLNGMPAGTTTVSWWRDVTDGGKGYEAEIGELLFGKLARGFMEFAYGHRCVPREDDYWRDYDTRRAAFDDLAHAYTLLTPAERGQVEELFREHREPRE